jgi:hypothetical protein
MRHPTRLAAAAAALLSLLFASPAAALPDGPIGPYLEHQEEVLVLGTPAIGSLTDGFGQRWGRLHAGIDIGILLDLKVFAAAPGVVTATCRASTSMRARSSARTSSSAWPAARAPARGRISTSSCG